MKRSTKIIIGIITFFIIITIVVVGRYSVGLYFKKKFSKRPPPGVIVEIVIKKFPRPRPRRPGRPGPERAGGLGRAAQGAGSALAICSPVVK